jgi:PAS domain S-box-containing protein
MTFRSPELWFYLLGLSVLLVIALRRVLARQAPLSDELYSKTVAIEHVQSGVAWIRADGSVKTINASFASTLGALQRELLGKEWYDLFAQQDRSRLQEAFSQMLLLGKCTLEAMGKRMDGTYAGLEILLVAVHDHKMRFVGHHCLIADRTRERLLEEQLAAITPKRTERRPNVTSASR